MDFINLEDEDIFEDDMELLELIDFGFPRRRHTRSNLFETYDEFTFFRHFRLYRQTALNVLTSIEIDLEYATNKNNSVSPMNQLLACLRFYATGSHQLTIADFSGMDRTTACRIMYRVTNSICTRLTRHLIKMHTREQVINEQLKFYRIAKFPRVIGVVDGTHIRIVSPGGEEGEIFRNRKNYFSINVQVTCNADLKIIHIVSRWPGSVHDVTMFLNSSVRRSFELGQYDNGLLLGDGGYGLKPYFLTPLSDPTTYQETKYNESFNKTRNIVDRVIGVWKKRFPCLALGMRMKVARTLSVIVATATLHNVARLMNEPEPPLPEHINQHHIDYLLEIGNINNAYEANDDINIVQIDLIENHFVHL